MIEAYGATIPSLNCEIYHQGLINDLEVAHNAVKKCVDKNLAVTLEKNKLNKQKQSHQQNYEHLTKEVHEVFTNEEDLEKRFQVSSIQTTFFLNSDPRSANRGLIFIADTIR